LVTAICGEVTNGQVVVTLPVTAVPVHWSLPLAVSVAVTEQESSGVVKLPLKLADAPGAREGTVNTGVLGTGWLLTTVMLVSVTFPGLLTLPM
jgi:hypothetical protein